MRLSTAQFYLEGKTQSPRTDRSHSTLILDSIVGATSLLLGDGCALLVPYGAALQEEVLFLQSVQANTDQFQPYCTPLVKFERQSMLFYF